MMGCVRALDAGTLPLEQFVKLIRGQDLSILTSPWESYQGKKE